jgi:hypothetical protein
VNRLLDRSRIERCDIRERRARGCALLNPGEAIATGLPARASKWMDLAPEKLRRYVSQA